MTFAPSPNQSGIQGALRAFLIDVLPAGVEVIEGQDNRVPEPQGADFVVMTTIRRDRIATNQDDYQDCVFIASIDGTLMTVSEVRSGVIAVGNSVFGLNVASATTITANGSGSGGIGTYQVAPSQTVASETMAAGTETIEQPTRVTVQLDFHSADVGNSADMAQTFSTLFRDPFAARFFARTNPNISPLHADEPRQIPFLNAEQQWETRWVVDATLQANQTITLPQQFAAELTPDLENVEVEYPA